MVRNDQGNNGYNNFDEVPNSSGYDSFDDAPATSATRFGKRKKKSTEKKVVTNRVVKTNRKIFLVFAAVVGLLAVLITTSTTKTVYVARASIAVGALQTPPVTFIDIAKINPNNLEPTAWSGKDKNALLTLVSAALAGKRTVLPIGVHQQLRPELFSSQIESLTQLGPNDRLVSISAKAAAAIVGTLKSGDYVDVYAASSSGLTGLLASNVEIVAVSIMPDQLDSISQSQVVQKTKQLSDLVPGNPIPGTYVLKVKSTDVANFIAVDAAAKIYLTLRGESAGTTPDISSDVITALCSGANASSAACKRAHP